MIQLVWFDLIIFTKGRRYWWRGRCGEVESWQATEVNPQSGRVYILSTMSLCQTCSWMTAQGQRSSHWPLFMDDWTRTKEQWTGVNDCSFVLVQSSMKMSDKVTLWRVYKPCLTGDSPQLLANSPPLHTVKVWKWKCESESVHTFKMRLKNTLFKWGLKMRAGSSPSSLAYWEGRRHLWRPAWRSWIVWEIQSTTI